MRNACLFAASAVLAAVPFAESSACSAIIVGKKASSTGYVLAAHNDDGSLAIRVRHAVVPARDGRLGFFWSECKDPAGGITPGDTLLNECGVLVMSNHGGFMKSWMGRPGALPDEGAYSGLGEGGVGFELRRTIAERAHSAREGVDIATNLLTRFGYVQPSRNFAIADKDEAWILSVIGGRRFVARRCPDDAVVAYPNCLTVTRIEPGDIVSGNIAARRDDFDFTAAYQGPRTWHSPYNLYRMRYLYKGTCGIDPGEPDAYPFSMRPQASVTPAMIMSTLSTHYEGTPDEVRPHPLKVEEVHKRAKAPICRSSTLESFVCVFAGSVTNIEMKVATGRPCVTPYASYRPFGGVLPTDVSRGDEAVRRLEARDAALPSPARVGIFAGDGPRANGFAEYLRLMADSPDIDLMLLDADDIRSGALRGLDLLVMPGGDSRTEKRDLGERGAERIREFLRNGGGYIGSCAGCCLLLDAETDPERGIGIIPYRRTGSKDGFLMPVKVNAKGAKALGVTEKTYVIRYHGGPVLEPSANAIDGADFEIWGTYEQDFGKPGAKPEMAGRGAMVGGTYGKGRVFAFAVHPENFPATRELVRGAFRYVLGRDVEFPERKRAVGAYSVGWYSNAVAGKEVAQAMLAVDRMEGADLFPLSSDEILQGMLDHVDLLVVPDGNAKFYRTKVTSAVKTLIAAFQSRGGRIVGWGEGARRCAGLVEDLGSAAAVLDAVAAEVGRRGASGGEQAEGIGVGFGRVDITPPLGAYIPGYFSHRLATGVRNPLKASCVAFASGCATATVFTVDNLHLTRPTIDAVHGRLQAEFGIPPELAFIHSTHIHQGAATDEKYYTSITNARAKELCGAYSRELEEKLTALAGLAIADMRKSTFRLARGEVRPAISFIRRYRMKDGSVVTNPSREHPEAVERTLGEADNSVQLVRVCRAGAPDIAIVNFQTHPDTVGGLEFDSDWPGALRDEFERAQGDGTHLFFMNGAQGDTNQHQILGTNHFWKTHTRAEYRGYMGKAVADAVRAIWDRGDRRAFRGRIRGRIENARIASNRPDAARVEAIRLFDAGRAGEIRGFGPMEIKAMTSKDSNARKLMNGPDHFDIPVSTLAIGDLLAFAGFPGEPFTEIGRKVKDASPFPMTIVGCLVNDSCGYLPSSTASKEGGYEVVASRFGATCGDTLVRAQLAALAEFYGIISPNHGR